MALILGLDPSQKTGWALYDTQASLTAIKAGVIKAGDWEKGQFEEMAGSLGRALKDLIKENGRPDFAVVEKAPRQQYGGEETPVEVMGVQTGHMQRTGPGLQGTLSTNQMAAALCAILGAFNIPYEVIMPSMWRKRAYGFGTHKGWERKDWKRHSREKCGQLKIKATNDDMAEAVWIAFAGAGCQTFKMLSARAA
jgi:hypothetical protein